MTARTGICPGCGETKRIGTVSAPAAALFCQGCAHGIPEKPRVVIVQLVGMQRCMDLNVRKLEANAKLAAVERAQLFAVYHRLKSLLGDQQQAELFRKALPCWEAALGNERGPLLAKITRQAAAIEALRRKHRLPHGPAWGRRYVK